MVPPPSIATPPPPPPLERPIPNVDDPLQSIPKPADRWQTRVAVASAATMDRRDDAATEQAAVTLLDRGRFGVAIALTILISFGVVAGWASTREVFRPVDAPVNVAVAMLVIVGGPWLLVGLRTIVLVLLGRRIGSWTGRLIPYGFVRWTERHAKDRRLGVATARQLGSMLSAGAGRHLAGLGGAAFWCGYGVAAVLAIWLSTARVAYGFGWESSWMSPDIGRNLVQTVATPLSFAIDTDALAPIATDASTDTSLEDRRRWILLLSGGIGLYLVVPMTLWAILHAVRGHLAANRWRPAATRGTPTDRTPEPRLHTESASTPPRSPSACTHLIRLEHATESVRLPSALESLEDLGVLDSKTDLDRLRTAAPLRVAVLAWLPATPDRGVIRRLEAVVHASKAPPLVVLDGGDALRHREPDRTVVARLADWRDAVIGSGSEAVECDLAVMTSTSRSLLGAAIAGRPVPEVVIDPTVLDQSFGLIGQGLDGSPSLPNAEVVASIATDIAQLHDRIENAETPWIRDLRSRVLHVLDGVEVAPETIRTLGVGLLPSALRRSAVWMGVGGILGIGACAAIATIAPAALAALPGWAGSGAGLGGILGLTRLVRSAGATKDRNDGDPLEPEVALGEAVLGLAGWSVLAWSQGGDEDRTARLLASLHADDDPPRFADCDEARRWLAAARQRLMEAIS